MCKIPSQQRLANPTRVTASVAIKATAGRILAVLLEGGTTASSIDFTNDANGAGTPIIGVTVPFTDADASAQDSRLFDFTKFGGLAFDSKIYAVLAGTGAVAYVWFD
jgi:hypothetical protein